MGYALVKIKDGTPVMQDMRFGRWQSDIDTPAVFVGEKGPYGWKCTGPDCGGEPYGKGAIYVGDIEAVEMLTPLLGYKPDLPEGE